MAGQTDRRFENRQPDPDRRIAAVEALEQMLSYGHAWTDPNDDEVRVHAQTAAIVWALLAVADEIRALRVEARADG